MRARWLINLTLLVVVATLIALVMRKPAEEGGQRVSALDPARVGRAHFKPAGREGFELYLEGGRWQVGTPLNLPANELRIRALLQVLSARSHAGFRAAGNDLSRFGLSPPRARLDVDGQIIDFGDTEPLDGRRYVLHDGQVHLVTDAFFQHLDAEAATFVHPAPLGPEATPVELELPSLRIRLNRSGWAAEPPAADPAAVRLDELATAWREAHALRVRGWRADLAWGPTIQVRLEGRASPLQFRVARTEFELILGRPDAGIQYHLPRAAGERLLRVD